MKLLHIALALRVFQKATAHSTFTNFFINDINQGDATCVRMPMTPDNATYPINDLASKDMACGFDGTKGVSRVCTVLQGAKLSFEWREWPDGSQTGSIDPSHKGPCAVYMKAVNSSITDEGVGSGWFKIWDSGYDENTSQWCTEKLINDNGIFSVNVPTDLVGGYYLVRPELLALHEADKKPPNPQFYAGCAQIFLQSSGTAVPEDTVSIPGYVHAGDPPVIFNIYTPTFPYPLLGPSPYVSSSQGAGGSELSNATAKTQKEGLKPADCVLINANWCGIEIDFYSTEDGCWNASQTCWDQAGTCYSSAPPTGSKNCHIWEDKCTSIQTQCNTGNFDGPPNKGKNLTPAIDALDSIPNASPVTEGNKSSGNPLYPFSTVAAESENLKSSSSMKTSPISISPTKNSSTMTATANEGSSTSLEAVTVTNTLTVIPIPALLSTDGASLITDMYKAFTLPSTNIISSITNTFKSYTIQTSNSNPSPTLSLSNNGNCGSDCLQTCHGSVFGNCCSQYGWCGSTLEYCGPGCKIGFGMCSSGYENKVKEPSKHRQYRAYLDI